MLRKFARLFVIKTRFDAMVVIYALALGAVMRGEQYLQQYPGFGGYALFAACTGAVFLAGAKLMEVTRPDSGKRRRRSDPVPSRRPGRLRAAGAKASSAPPAFRRHVRRRYRNSRSQAASRSH